MRCLSEEPVIPQNRRSRSLPCSYDPATMDSVDTGIYLYWIPLGAGGSGFVRTNGRIYEAIESRRRSRSAVDLYHTALQVRLPERRFIVETMWPSPAGNPAERGVVVVAPVFASWLSFTRIFRYEVRCWPDGNLPDADEAFGGPQPVSRDEDVSRRVLDLTKKVPKLVWGRDEADVGEMWNSNSVISWLLTRAGVEMNSVTAPEGGRAPGWDAGIVVAGRQAGESLRLPGTSDPLPT